MPRMPKIRNGKFRLKYNTADGHSVDAVGEIVSRRSEYLFKMFEATVFFGEKCVPGLSEVLDQYIKDYDARVAETEAKKETA